MSAPPGIAGAGATLGSVREQVAEQTGRSLSLTERAPGPLIGPSYA